MVSWFRCSAGHRWESVTDCAESTCPVCGGDSTLQEANVVPARDAQDPTLSVVPDSAPPLFATLPVTGEPVAFRPRPDRPAIPCEVLPEIDGYESLSLLGRGGMGVVYRATHVRLKRPVALKMILAGEYAGQQEVARFHREAEAIARIQHPHIVQIFEVGQHQGTSVHRVGVRGRGQSGELSRRNSPAAAGGRPTGSLLADAVEAAHQAGIVHRDLKPANVLLAGPEREPNERQSLAAYTPKITDFGLAKQMDTDSVETRSGAILGSPSYMAPEQAAGMTQAVGPAADIYALGAILYELLTGRPPFRGTTVLETLEQVRRSEPVSPRQLNAGTPRDLETICLKCLDKDPRRRYETARALAADLRRYQAGEPIVARPVGPLERSWKWARRRPALALLLLVSFAAALGLLGLWASFTAKLRVERDLATKAGQDAERERIKAVEEQGKTERARQETQLALTENHERLVSVNVTNGWRMTDEGDVAAALPRFAEAYRLDLGRPDRTARHRLRLAGLVRRCPRPAHQWRYQDDVVAAISPDGRMLALGGEFDEEDPQSDKLCTQVWSWNLESRSTALNSTHRFVRRPGIPKGSCWP